jgi:hypothetical protein
MPDKGVSIPEIAGKIRIKDSHAANITNGAFWEHKGSAPLVGGGKISVKDLTGPGKPSNPVWTITKPDGERIVIRGLGIKDGKPSGINAQGHGNYEATITKPNGEKTVVRQSGSKGSHTLYSASGQVGPVPTGGKKNHAFHGNQYTAHGSEVPVKGKTKSLRPSLDFTTDALLDITSSYKP